MTIKWPSRIATRAANLIGGDIILRLAEQPGVVNEIRRFIENGRIPVTVLSAGMRVSLGEVTVAHKKLAGEVVTFLAEKELGAVRSSGSRKITGDHVFTSGTPFKMAATSPPHGGVVISLEWVKMAAHGGVWCMPATEGERALNLYTYLTTAATIFTMEYSPRAGWKFTVPKPE